MWLTLWPSHCELALMMTNKSCFSAIWFLSTSSLLLLVFLAITILLCRGGGACCSAIVQNTTILKLIMLEELYQHPHSRKMFQQIGPLNNVLFSRRWNTLDWWFTSTYFLPTNIYYRLEIILPSIGFYSTVNSLTHSLLFDINWWFYNFYSFVRKTMEKSERKRVENNKLI